MRKTVFNFSFLVLLSITPFEISAQKYVIDSGHSNVQIKIERFGVVDVVGRFKDVSGSFNYDKENPSSTSAQASIKVSSYDANNVGGEAAVKSEAFLDEANYPAINFVSTNVSEKDGMFYLVGDLTIHGTTNTVELPMSIKGPLLDFPTKKQSIAFNSTITIDRLKYGVSFDKKLPDGTWIIGNEVEITLNILALKE